MLWIEDIAAWLEGRWPADIDGLRVEPPDGWHRGDETLPPMPDRLVGLTVTGGIGANEADGRLMNPTIQVRARGLASLPGQDGRQRAQSAEALAWAVDLAFLAPGPHGRIGARHVVSSSRVTGPPSFDRRDRARLHMVCTYTVACDYPDPQRGPVLPA